MASDRTEFEYCGMEVGELLRAAADLAPGPIPYEPYRGPGHYDLCRTLDVTSNVPCVVRRSLRRPLLMYVATIADGCVHVTSVRALPRGGDDPGPLKRTVTAHQLLQDVAKRIGSPETPELGFVPAEIVRNPDIARAHAVRLFDQMFEESLVALPRGGVWRDLMRVCDLLNLPERVPACRAELNAALRRVASTGGEEPR